MRHPTMRVHHGKMRTQPRPPSQDAAYHDFLNSGSLMGLMGDDEFIDSEHVSPTLPGVSASKAAAAAVVDPPLEGTSNIRYTVPRATTASFESVHLPPPARSTGTSRTSRLLRLSKEHRFSTTPQNFSSRGSL